MTLTTAIEANRANYLNELERLWHDCTGDDPYPAALAQKLAPPPGWRPPKEPTPTPAPAPAARRSLFSDAVEADEFASLGAMSCCDGY